MVERVTTHRVSISFNRALRTFAEIAEWSRRISENRGGPPLRLHITSRVQAPRSKTIHAESGQPFGAAILGRTFKTML